MDVRQVTGRVLGGSETMLWRSTETPSISTIDIANFRPGSGDRLKFLFAKGQPVKVAVFAAKFDTLERAYILMTPMSGKPSNLMIVITHGFGQNDAYYSKLGYSDPLSPDLIRDVNSRFVLGRWGAQLMAAWSDCALLLPVRARGGGHGELGPFISQATMGAGVVEGIMVESERAVGIDSIDVSPSAAASTTPINSSPWAVRDSISKGHATKIRRGELRSQGRSRFAGNT
jgi:hypothetical protein